MFKSINGGKLPTRATRFSAGVDVYANEDVIIGAGKTAIIGLGITIDDTGLHKTILSDFGGIIEHSEIDRIETYKKWFLSSHYISLKPRNRLRAKGIISHSAVINLDYKDEIKMIINNLNNNNFQINKGNKIGKMLLIEHKSYLFGIESDEERTGGFGSTGK